MSAIRGFTKLTNLLLCTHREFFVHLSNFKNVTGFDKDLNYGTSTIRRYSINVNNPTLETLLTKLADNTQIPSDERDVKRAVSVIGRESNGRGQTVWCLSENLTLDSEGNEVICEDYSLEWISHLTEGDGRFIAKRELACTGQGPLTTKYLNIACHFLADSLGKVCSNDVAQRVVVNEIFGEDTSLYYDGKHTVGVVPARNNNRAHFLSQLYIASMGVIIANLAEVRNGKNLNNEIPFVLCACNNKKRGIGETKKKKKVVPSKKTLAPAKKRSCR